MAFSTSHDLQADALYITFSEAGVVRTVELDSGALVDVDVDGRAIGLEVIHPHRQWPLEEFVRDFQISDDVARALREYSAKFRTPTPTFNKVERTSSGSGKLAILRPISA